MPHGLRQYVPLAVHTCNIRFWDILHVHTNTFLRLLSPTHTHTHAARTLTHTHTLTRTHAHTQTHSLIHTHALSLSLSHTHTHTHRRRKIKAQLPPAKRASQTHSGSTGTLPCKSWTNCTKSDRPTSADKTLIRVELPALITAAADELFNVPQPVTVVATMTTVPCYSSI